MDDDRAHPLLPGVTSALTTAGQEVATPTRWTLPAGLAVVLGLALGGLALVSLILLASGDLPSRPYGDGDVFTQFVAAGRSMPRWLLGSAAAAALHAAIWEFPPVRNLVPTGYQSPGAFLALLCTLTMAAGTAALWRRWPGRLHVLLPATTPIWALFLSGYVEYYPLIAVPFVAVLAWLFDRPLAERTPRQIGLLVGLLPAVYIAFAPVALAIGVAWALARRSGGLRAAGTAVLAACVAVAVSWPEGVVHYFRALYQVFNFGEAHLASRYAGQVAGPDSILFSTGATLSTTRMREAGFLLVRGGGWWALPTVVGLAATWTRRWSAVAWRDARVWLGLALTVWQLYYLAFMVPRLGPVADIDLFFSTYLWLAFLAGLLLDARRVGGRHDVWAWGVVGVAVLSLAWVAPGLVWHGLPPLD